jgi:hypothetical protein
VPGIGLAMPSGEKPEEKGDKGGQHSEAGKEGDAGTRNHLGSSRFASAAR